MTGPKNVKTEFSSEPFCEVKVSIVVHDGDGGGHVGTVEWPDGSDSEHSAEELHEYAKVFHAAAEAIERDAD